MKILIAPDKFKGTLTSSEVCDALATGLSSYLPGTVIRKFPLADGGDGTLEVFLFHTGGRAVFCTVNDPLMNRINASYGISNDKKTAFIEMAQASGMECIGPEKRNPLYTTTFGTGEMVADALEKGVTNILLGIGGSATNDAAIGAASALGYKFLDSQGHELFPSGENLIKIRRIVPGKPIDKLTGISITAICDVTSPFYGPSGAAFIYAPQKGADPPAVEALNLGLQNFAKVLQEWCGIDVQKISGSGAGGGFAGGAHALLGASLKPGARVVMETTDFEKSLQWADIVITGEGKIDDQTLQGKLIREVAQVSKKNEKHIMAVCGRTSLLPEQQHKLGITKIVSLTSIAGEEKAMKLPASLLQNEVALALSNHIKESYEKE